MTKFSKNKPVIYVDIDGVLLANEENLSEGAANFIKYIADNFEVYWLTTHCMHGDPEHAIAYVNRASDEDLTPWLNKFKPTTWSLAKTDAIDMSKPFLWYDDDCLWGEKKALHDAGLTDSWVKVDLYAKQDQMVWEQITLRGILEDDTPNPKNIYELMERSGLTLLVGQTGSGKSVLVSSYLNYMANKYSIDEWGVVAIDLLQFEYSIDDDNDYLMQVSRNSKDDSGLELLKRTAFMAVDRTMKRTDRNAKKITIHITECDLAVEDIGYFLDYMNKISISFAMESGIQVIYETSRIAEDTIPPELLEMSQLRLMQIVPNQETAEYFAARKVKIPNEVGATVALNLYYKKYIESFHDPVKSLKGPFGE